jgi:uncharacterized protein (TIGR03086 family)
MTTQLSELLAAAAARTVPVVQGIGDDQLDSATPCDDFRVRDLLNHLFQVVVNMQAMADRKPGDFSSTPDAIEGDWRGRFAAETEQLIAAWSDPAALEGVSAGMGLPQPVIGGLALADLTVHGWDLARATGQPYEPDPAVVAYLRPQIEQMAPQARAMGAFGEPAPVAPDATDFEHLLALTGRSSASS